MIDWLRKEMQEPAIEVAGRTLPIAIRRHARAKRLTMRLAPDGSEIRITLPKWGRTIDALTFAKARSEWLARQLGKVPEPIEIADGATIPFCGKELTLRWHAENPRKVRREGSELHLGGPQESIAQRVQRWLEGEARRNFERDLAFYCQRAGLEAPELRLSRAQRRWGSCSGQARSGQRIRINWRLIMAPEFVRRSVVAHEVAHLVHFDHSPAFHTLLEKLFEGELSAADAWLKSNGRSLYSVFG